MGRITCPTWSETVACAAPASPPCGPSCAAEPDHVPHFVGDGGLLPVGTAYCIATMRALLHRAIRGAG